MTRYVTGALLCAALLLAACGEKAQGPSARKSDVPAWQGGGGDKAYTADGWKAGDQASWESQIRNRAQSQNEYARAPLQ